MNKPNSWIKYLNSGFPRGLNEMPYEILEHSADEKFRATGEDLEEAFSAAVEAFSDIVGGDSGQTQHDIEVESENLEALLFDFLDKLIFLQDTRGVVISYAEKMEIEELEDGYRLNAEVLTDPLSGGTTALDIKAPTYNEMKVDYEDGTGWVLEAVLDV